MPPLNSFGKSFVDLDRIKIVEFTGPEGVEALREDIEILIQQFGEYDHDFIDWVKEHPEILTLVFVDDEPAAYIRIDGFDVGKDSLEFSGCVMPEYRDLQLTDTISPVAIRNAFRRTGKRKMLAAIDEHNKPAQYAIARLGFRRIGRDPEKRLLYRLDRKNALAQKTL